MSAHDPITAMAEAYTAAWCSQDPERVASFFTETGVLTINDGTPSVGRDAIARSAASFMTAFPDLVVVMDALHVHGHSARYDWTLMGTNTGPGGTGKAVRISGHEQWTLTPSHRVEHSLGYFDTEEYARQLRDGVA